MQIMFPENSSRTEKPIFMNFIFGGIAGVSATIIGKPFKMIKNSYRINIFDIVKKQGPMLLYKGMAPILFQRALYNTIRIGVYESLNDNYKLNSKNKEPPTLLHRTGIGGAATGLALFIGAPTQCIYKIVNEPVNLTNKENMINTIRQKIRKEGYLYLWRHQKKRAASSMIQLAAYSQSKLHLIKFFHMENDTNLYILASAISSFVKTCARIPLTYIELHLEKLNCCRKYSSYIGFFHDKINAAEFRQYFRHIYSNTVHTMLTFVILEKLNNLYAEYILCDKSKGSGL